MPNSIERSVINAISQEGKQCCLSGGSRLLSEGTERNIMARIIEDGHNDESLLQTIKKNLERMVTVVSTGKGVFFRPSEESSDVLQTIIAKHNQESGRLFLDTS